MTYSRIPLLLLFVTAGYSISEPALSSHSVRIDSSPPTAKGLVMLLGKPEDLAANWQRIGNSEASWKFKDGAFVAGGGDILTKQEFADFQLHLEFKVPLMEASRGQARGNSGVKLHSLYEIQILDSFGKEEPGTGDCGALYQQAAPLVNACKRPNEWQNFDITFRAARLGADGTVSEPARVTVVQNGITVQNNQVIKVPTGRRGGDRVSTQGPIRLQDHRCPVEFRNIWILPLPAQGAQKY